MFPIKVPQVCLFGMFPEQHRLSLDVINHVVKCCSHQGTSATYEVLRFRSLSILKARPDTVRQAVFSWFTRSMIAQESKHCTASLASAHTLQASILQARYRQMHCTLRVQCCCNHSVYRTPAAQISPLLAQHSPLYWELA